MHALWASRHRAGRDRGGHYLAGRDGPEALADVPEDDDHGGYQQDLTFREQMPLIQHQLQELTVAARREACAEFASPRR